MSDTRLQANLNCKCGCHERMEVPQCGPCCYPTGEAANVRNVTTGAREFRAKWSHKPTPIPPDATGLWYSEECCDQMLDAYRSQVLQEAIEKVEALPQSFTEKHYNGAIDDALAVLREMKG